MVRLYHLKSAFKVLVLYLGSNAHSWMLVVNTQLPLSVTTYRRSNGRFKSRSSFSCNNGGGRSNNFNHNEGCGVSRCFTGSCSGSGCSKSSSCNSNGLNCSRVVNSSSSRNGIKGVVIVNGL